MKVILLNPPRYYWPYLSEGDNYILPQALPCLAAVLRENDIEAIPIDCLPSKIGWKSLEKIIEKEKPDVVGVCTSETMFTPEAIKACDAVKKIDKNIITAVGGAHFSNLPDDTLKNNPSIDFVIVGEGEYTLLELVKEAEKSKPDFKGVKGLAFRAGKKIIHTPPRPLIANLDELPIPAYDLMPMKEYGKGHFLFSPGGTTIHHSRGCIYNCEFCVWWVQMSERKLVSGKTFCYPRWRTKSVERTLDEMEILRYKYKKKYLEFVDDNWNVDPKWSNSFADSYKERGMDVKWFGFMRADLIMRDEKMGIFKKLVDSGLVKLCIGVERPVDKELNSIGKKAFSSETTKKCFHLLRDKYPQIFRQGTFIVGTRDETTKSMLDVVKYAKEIDADYPSFHPITPIPGTTLWAEAKKNNWIEVKDFSKYDWLTPIMPSKYLSRDEIEDNIFRMNREFVNAKWLIKGLLSSGAYKRNMYLWWLVISMRMFSDAAKEFLLKPVRKPVFLRYVKPSWYDS